MSNPNKLTPEQEAAAKAEADRVAVEANAKAKATADKARADQGPAAANSGLVKVEKNGETLQVHPTCVKAHEQVGFKVVQ
jgi:hypothetical protein